MKDDFLKDHCHYCHYRALCVVAVHRFVNNPDHCHYRPIFSAFTHSTFYAFFHILQNLKNVLQLHFFVIILKKRFIIIIDGRIFAYFQTSLHRITFMLNKYWTYPCLPSLLCHKVQQRLTSCMTCHNKQ